MPTLIYLIGFMGSGKTTLGQILANVLGFDFVDLDAVFEERTGRSIAVYFAESGEEAFRAAERLLVEETVLMEKTVVAAGGGAFLVREIRELMLNRGFTVYLRLPVSVLASRLRSSRNRPLLYDRNGVTLKGGALHGRIEQLLEERSPLYEQAHLIVDIDDQSIGRSVDRIVDEIQKSANKPG